MKKSRLFGVTIFGIIIFTSSVLQAATITYTDSYDFYNPGSLLDWSKEWQYICGGCSWTWTFDLTTQGFNPLTESVLSAELSVILADDNVIIHPGDSRPDHPLLDNKEQGQIDADSQSFFTGELGSPQTYTYLLSPDSLQDNGMLVVTFTSLNGDSVFDRSSLIVETSTIPQPSTYLAPACCVWSG